MVRVLCIFIVRIVIGEASNFPSLKCIWNILISLIFVTLLKILDSCSWRKGVLFIKVSQSMGSTTYVDKMLLISYYEAIGNGIKEWFGILTAEVDARVCCEDCSNF